MKQFLEADWACENIRFSTLFAAGDVSRGNVPAAKSAEKGMFSQARKPKAWNKNHKHNEVHCNTKMNWEMGSESQFILEKRKLWNIRQLQ